VYEPDWADYTFDALSFSSPSDGWIVGNRFILRVENGDVSVFFIVGTSVWPGSVDAPTRDEAWAAGSRVTDSDAAAGTDPWDPPWRTDSVGVLWRYNAGRWQSIDLAGLDWDDWSIVDVFASPTGEVWATAVIDLDPDDALPPAQFRFKPILLRWDGATLRVEWEIREGDRRWQIADLCFDSDGSGWFVGTDFADPALRKPLAVRRRNGHWERADLPPLPPGRISGLTSVACLPNGRLVTWGASTDRRLGVSHPFVLRFDGSWEVIELPERYRAAEIGAMAAPAYSDIWLAVTNIEPRAHAPAAFLRWVAGEWHEVPLPKLPEGRIGGFVFKDMQFVSPTEAWAIADDSSGPGLSRGFIFHYRDGVWRNRNWSWHLWDMPWFGLFGD
jgi:hypothetical protein